MQENIINNDAVRHAVQNNGFEPWLLPKNSPFRFILPWNSYGLGALPIEAGRVLWLKMFPMWGKCTLQSPFFEAWIQYFNFTLFFLFLLVHLQIIFTLGISYSSYGIGLTFFSSLFTYPNGGRGSRFRGIHR